jgi:hypothetical protein
MHRRSFASPNREIKRTGLHPFWTDLKVDTARHNLPGCDEAVLVQADLKEGGKMKSAKEGRKEGR